MNTLTSNFTSSRIMYWGLALILTLISGVILSNLGRPLNSAIFTVHKLIAVGTVILLGVTIRNLYKTGDFHTLSLVLIVVTGLIFLTLIVSGALLSFERPVPQTILKIHQIAPLLAVAASIMSVYLLVSNKS